MISLEDIGASGFIVAQERIKELQKMDMYECSFILLFFSKKIPQKAGFRKFIIQHYFSTAPSTKTVALLFNTSTKPLCIV